MNQEENPDSQPSQANDLRREAQQRLHDKSATPVEGVADADVRAMLHELQVHQIELEMQNEELRRAQMAVQEVSDKYLDLFDFAPVDYFLLDEQGRILEVNLAGAAKLGLDRNTAITQRFGQYVAPQDRARFAQFRKDVLAADSKQTCEFELRKGKEPVHVVLEGIAAQNHRFLRIAAIDITERKRTEEALAESETKYRRLHESMTDAFVSVDMQCHVLEFNKAYQRMLGYSGEELRRQTYVDLTPEKWHAFEAQIVTEQVLARGYSEVYEKEYQRKDGTIFPVELRTFLIRDERNEPTAMWAIVRDITERKEAEEALRASKEHYRTVADFTYDWEFWLAPDGRYKYVSPSVLRITGREVPPGMVAEEFLRLIVHPQDMERRLEHLHASLAGGSPNELEFRIVRPEGSVRWIHQVCQPVYDGEGQFLGIRGSNRDITDRKQAELELDRLHEMLEEGQRLAHLGSWEHLVGTGKTIWSKEQFRIFGLEPEPQPPEYAELLQKYFHPDDTAWVDRSFTAAVKSASSIEWEHRIVRPDGTVRVLHELALPHFDADGKLDRYLGATLDITERKRTEAQLEASLRDLREAQEELVRKERLATLGKLAGSVAHEIRTPLSVIRNNLKFLMDALPSSDGEMCEVLAEMDRAVGNSDHIITEMLDYVREPVGAISAFPIRNVISDALRRFPLPQTVQFLSPDGSESAIEVSGNQDQITRILINLFENAVQAMTQGGTLEVNARREGAGKVCLSVMDTGCGIPEENLKRIFEPLFSTKTRGIGLGLAIAQRYANLNGGSLSVESKVGHGSTFRLSLNAGLTE